MKIGIDARMYNESGNGRYLRNLLIQLRLSDHKNFYVVYCLEKDFEAISLVLSGDNWRIVPVSFKWYTVAEQLYFPRLLYRERFDLVHFPHFNVPFLYFRPFVVTIHDLTHYMFAMRRASTHSAVTYYLKHQAYSFVFQYAVKRSVKIFTVSQFVKRAILEKFRCSEDKVVVTYEAAEKPIALEEGVSQKVLKKLSVRQPYFMYVGNAHPHKNLEFLLQSFAEFRKDVPDIRLILVGKENYFWTRLMKWAADRNLLSNVTYLGYVDDYHLAVLYREAFAFVFPSLSEGFGLPVLEAMTYGCPVVCSDGTSLPEVAGDAAIYFDPSQQDSLVRAMHTLYSSTGIREERRKLGFAQVKKFSWYEMGKQTLREYALIQD